MGTPNNLRGAFDGTTPIGLRPKWVVDELRRVEILEAMLRYAHQNPPKKFPDEWVSELSQLQFSSRPSQGPTTFEAIRAAYAKTAA